MRVLHHWRTELAQGGRCGDDNPPRRLIGSERNTGTESQPPNFFQTIPNRAFAICSARAPLSDLT